MEEQKEPKLEVVRDEIQTESKKEELRKPTPEEVEQFKQDFSNAMSEFDDIKWEISEPGNFAANDVGMFLLEFMDKYAFWSKTEWMGMIKMYEEVDKAMKLANKNTGLRFSYQALEFCAYMLSNPGGTGIELAKDFEKIADKYSKIGVVVGTQVENARKRLKQIHFLQDRYVASEQGRYLEDVMDKKEYESMKKELDEYEELKKMIKEKAEEIEKKEDKKEE